MAQASSAPLPASGQGCAIGWDQLLPADQRATPAQAPTSCNARTADALTPGRPPRLAEQMAIYGRASSQGPLGSFQTRTIAPQQRRAPTRPASAGPRWSPPPGRPSALPVMMAPLIDQAARTHDIDPLLLHAIARVESRHQPRAVSHAGAHGMMQVIVPTARRFGVGAASELHDPQVNLQVSARYLKTLQQRFGNDLPLVLAAYNAGEGAVEKYGRRVPPYRETQDYVRKVLAEYGLLRRVSAGRAGPNAAALERFAL